MNLEEAKKGLRLGIAKKGGAGAGDGDMLKSVYDVNDNGIVDKSETIDDGVGNSVSAANVKDAVDKKHSNSLDHIQGTDQYLDQGGANQVAVTDVKDAVDKKHSQNTDTILTTGGSLELFNAGYLKRNLLVDDGFNIQIDEIRARDADGLKLYDDGGNGIFIKDGGNVGIGMTAPSSRFHIKANTPGIVGSHHAGQLIIQSPIDSVITGNAVITGYESDGAGNPDQQLWYLGSQSSSTSDILFLNRRNSKLHLGTNGATRLTILGNGNVGIGTISPTQKLDVVGNAKLDGYLGIKDITIQYLNDTHQPVYLGITGLNDLSSSGVYSGTGTTFFEIKITGVGSPNNFSYREGDTGSFSSPIAMTGAAQLLQDGIYVTFAATTGHRMQDVWHISVGYMLNFDKAVHMEDHLFVDGDITIEGNLKSLSPVKIQDGIILISRISDTPEFHIFIAGDSTEYTPYLPDAFKYALVFKTLNHSNPSNMHIAFWETASDRPSLVLNQGEAGRASVFERSVIIGANKATKTLDTDYTKCNLFSNLVCDTSVTGAELGVEGNVEFLKNLYVTGDIQVNGNVRLNDAKFSINTGILYGGLLSINVGDNTKLDVTAGEAIIADFSDVNAPVINRVSWGAQTIYPNLSGVRSKWIGIRRLGGGSVEFVFDTAFTAEEKRTTAILGRAWGTGTDTITGKGQYSTPSFNLAKTVEDFIDTIGSLNKDGNVFQPNGVNLLLDKTPGHCFRFSAAFAASPPSPNMSTDAEQIGITSYKYHLQGSTTTTTETDIEPNYYDVSGVKTAVANNKYTIQRIYFFPVSGTVHITYGQAEYTSLAIASDAIQTEETVLNTDILSGSVLRAWLIVKQGTTDLSDPTKANIIIATNIGSTGGGAGGVTDHTSLSSLEWNVAAHTFNVAGQVMDIGSYGFVTMSKVGIQNSDPSSRLTVGVPHVNAQLNNDITSVNKIGAYTTGGLGVSIGHVDGERGSIYAYDYATWAAKNLVINEFGANVGIGINPTVKLDINGGGRFRGDLTIDGELKIKVYAQDAEPTLSADEFMAVWKDTNDSNRIYLIFRRGSGDQVSVELS